MKKSIKRTVVSLLCTTLLGGAIAMSGCTQPARTDSSSAMKPSSYSFDLLSASKATEKPEVNTSIPVGYMDLTKVYGFAGPANVEYEVIEGSHTTFTATADDPLQAYLKLKD